jgi:hypothetical protein
VLSTDNCQVGQSVRALEVIRSVKSEIPAGTRGTITKIQHHKDEQENREKFVVTVEWGQTDKMVFCHQTLSRMALEKH